VPSVTPTVYARSASRTSLAELGVAHEEGAGDAAASSGGVSERHDDPAPLVPRASEREKKEAH